MTYKSKDKSFFDDVIQKEEKLVSDTKEELSELEKKGKRKFLKLYDFGASRLRDEIKRKPAQYFFLFLTSFLGSVMTSGVALFIFSGNLISQFVPKPAGEVRAVQTQAIEKEVRVEKYDPLLLTSKLRKGDADFELVDIRSVVDYRAGHIKSAVNLPVYGSEIINDKGDLDGVALEQLFEKYLKSDKLLIIYAQNSYSTVPSDIAHLLNSGSKTVKALAIGFEEWEHLQSR